MRLVLVDNLLLEHGSWTHHFDLQPHLGLISLIAVAEANGHEGILFDPKLAIARGELTLDASLYREMALAILRNRPDVVGLTTLGCNFICTLKVAAYLKEFDPSLPVLVGGPHVSILHHEVAERFPQFDVIVRNEAEAVLPAILEGLQSDRLQDIPGLTYRRGSEVIETAPNPILSDLDQLPWPAYDHYPIKELGLRSIRVEAGRGCPFDCTFCSTASFFGRRYRLKSAERLCAELDYLHDRYGISEFALMHDLFTVSKAKVREFCDVVEGRGYSWRCSARMDCVDDALLERMSQAGCRSIYYGVETGSPRMQQIVSKHLDLSLYTPILDKTISLGMRPTASFITGYPEEDLEDQAQTLDLIGSSILRYPESLTVQLHLLTPEPGTQLIAQYGHTLAYDGHVSDFNFPTLEDDDGAIMGRHPEVFMNHHYYPGALPRQRHVFVTSAYLVLYRLGFGVLRILMEDFGRSLSRFIFEFEDWANVPVGDRVTSGLVEEFVADRFGQHDYRVSLVRHMFATTELTKQELARAPSATGSSRSEATPETRYRQAAASMVLGNIHAAADILKALSARSVGTELSDELRSTRGHCLLVLDGSDRRRVRSFMLNDASRVLLDFFELPRTLGEFRRAFGAPHFESERSEAALEWLLDVGALEPLDKPRGGPADTGLERDPDWSPSHVGVMAPLG